MDKFVKAGITEHKELVIRIKKLEKVINNWNPKDSTRSHVTYANLAILLASYKKAAEALECILENEGVTVDKDHCYREVVDRLTFREFVDRLKDDEPQDQPQGQPQNEQEHEC